MGHEAQVSIWLSIALLVGCAVLWDVAVVMQKRAADHLPPLALGAGLAHSLRRFITSPAWMGGLALSGAGWGLFAWALSFTPVSLARSVQGLGFVLLAVLSMAFLKHRLAAREWLGVGLVTLGVLALGLSEPPDSPTPTAFSTLGLVSGGAVVLGVCALLMAGLRLKARWPGTPTVSAIAGMLLGLGDVLTRALVTSLDKNGVLAVATIGPFLCATYIVGFFTLSRGYQQGRALLVTGVSDLAARLVTLGLGVLALNEALPNDPLLRLLRLGGFTSVLVGTALLARFSAEQLTRAPAAQPA